MVPKNCLETKSLSLKSKSILNKKQKNQNKSHLINQDDIYRFANKPIKIEDLPSLDFNYTLIRTCNTLTKLKSVILKVHVAEFIISL